MKKALVGAFAMFAFASSTIPAEATDQFYIVNRSDSEIEHVYLSNKAGNRSRDLLGRNGTIPSGDEVLVLSTTWRGCVHNVLVLTAGQFAFFKNFNTCVGPLYVSNKGLRYSN